MVVIIIKIGAGKGMILHTLLVMFFPECHEPASISFMTYEESVRNAIATKLPIVEKTLVARTQAPENHKICLLRRLQRL